MPVAHSAGVFDGRGSAEVLASVALLVLPSLPDKALCLSVALTMDVLACQSRWPYTGGQIQVRSV